MDRKERRRRARELKKKEDKLKKEGPRPHTEHNESIPRRTSARAYLARLTSRTRKLLWALAGAALALVGAYPSIRPHISVEPNTVLNPGDPFSTQFSVTNENLIFDTKDLQPSCRTIDVVTSHNVGMFGLPPRPSPPIPRLGPREKTTVTCPPWIGGLGAGAGNVLVAYIEIDISYRQNGWPLEEQERFPLRGVRDSQSGVHWTHITPEQLKADLSRQ